MERYGTYSCFCASSCELLLHGKYFSIVRIHLGIASVVDSEAPHSHLVDGCIIVVKLGFVTKKTHVGSVRPGGTIGFGKIGGVLHFSNHFARFMVP